MAAVDLRIPGIGEAVKVGQGGFGVVYRARQEAIGRTVAVKVLGVAALGDEDRGRFEREARALGAVSGHPNIVAIFDFGTSGEERPYLVMDYLPGGTLAERVARDGPLDWREVAGIAIKLAGALAAAHAAGVLHRDVKPENVLMSAYGEPQLVDFGIARFTGASHSRTGNITATLAHAAPEVLAGRPAGEASDVYSLASTLYELLSGHAPFVRASDETVHPLLQRALTEDPPDLTAAAGVPGAIWQALRTALAKDPAARPASARAFAEALQDAQRTLGEAVTPLVLPSGTGAPVPAPGAGDRAAPPAGPPVGPASAPPPGVGEPAVPPRAAGEPVVPAAAGEPGSHTVMRAARRPDPAPAAVEPADGSRRRLTLIAAGAASAILLVAAGAFALTRGDDDGARRVATAGAPASTAPVTTATTPATTAAPPPAATTPPAGTAPPAAAPQPPPAATTTQPAAPVAGAPHCGPSTAAVLEHTLPVTPYGKHMGQTLCFDFTGDGLTDIVFTGWEAMGHGAHYWAAFEAQDGDWKRVMVKHDCCRDRRAMGISIRRSDPAIVVSERIFGPDDPACCPSGGLQRGRWEWRDGRLTLIDVTPKDS